MYCQLNSQDVFDSVSFSDLLQLALEEDLGNGDVTTNSIVSESLMGKARIYAKSDLVVCGNDAVQKMISYLEPKVSYQVVNVDGTFVSSGSTIAEACGSFRALLSAERVSLNFIQRLSGIATVTRKYVEAVAGTGVRILDTRKTTPGHRLLEKYAVRSGGGTNHRFGLYDAVLIKNNHVDSLNGDVREAIRKARSFVPTGMKVQVEVRNIDELQQALTEDVDAVLLDNMTPVLASEAVKVIRSSKKKSIEIEASGGITLKNIKEYALTGVDSISIGAVTHSAPAVDIAMETLPL